MSNFGLKDRNKQETNLKFLFRDQSNKIRVFPVDDSATIQTRKSKVNSRSSVSKTEETQKIPLETNSKPGQPENPSGNESTVSAFVYWGVKKQLPSSESPRVNRVYKIEIKAANENPFQQKAEKVKGKTEKSKVKATQEEVADKAAFSGASREGEGSKANVEEKVIVNESVQENTSSSISSISIKKMLDLWESMETGQGTHVDSIKIKMGRPKKKDVRTSSEGEPKEIKKHTNNSQKVTSVWRGKAEDVKTPVSKGNGKEKKSSEDGEETSKKEKQEASKAVCQIPESPRSVTGLDEKEGECVEDSTGENVNDFRKRISEWEGVKKKCEEDVKTLNPDKYVHKNLSNRNLISGLESDFLEDIETHLQKIIAKQHKEMEKYLVAYSEGYPSETENVDLETESDDCRPNSAEESIMMTSSFEDPEAEPTDLSNPKDPETQLIFELMEQIKELKREMVELKSFVNFQKSESGSVSLSA